MKLYLICRTDDLTYGDCSAMIVASESEEDAMSIRPTNGNWFDDSYYTVHKKEIRSEPSCECIAEETHLPRGEVLADWNDG